MRIDEINLTPLLKAFKRFERFRHNDHGDEQAQAGTIQAYEYCFELCWKTMKRLLEQRGQQVNSPRETFRLAALEGFINDPELWFAFMKKRNLTVHTYELDSMQEMLAICPAFSEAIKQFLQKIGVPKNEY